MNFPTGNPHHRSAAPRRLIYPDSSQVLLPPSSWEHSAPKMHSVTCDKWVWKAHPSICVCIQLYLESQDNSPNKAKCQSVIPIHNIMRSHVF